MDGLHIFLFDMAQVATVACMVLPNKEQEESVSMLSVHSTLQASLFLAQDAS